MFRPERTRFQMKLSTYKEGGRSQGLRGLRRKSAAASLLGLRVRIPSGGTDVSYECCVLSRYRILLWADPSSGGVSYLACVSLVVIWYNYPLHLQWVGRRGHTKRKEKKVIRMYYRCHPTYKSSSFALTLSQLLPG